MRRFFLFVREGFNGVWERKFHLVHGGEASWSSKMFQRAAGRFSGVSEHP